MRTREATVPLLPRRRVHGTPLGDMRSGRRGDGAELVGLREYRRGDDPRRLDHRASARASCASGGDVLLVREFYADEAARVVLVLDRGPTMRLFPPGLPWLAKQDALRRIVRLLAASADEARCPLGCVSAGASGAAVAVPVRRPRTEAWTAESPPAAGALHTALDELARLPRLGKGTFVFVISDFLNPPGEGEWWRLLARGFDPVPVLVQDPLWERSFPDVGGVPLPVAAPDGSRTRLVRVSRREATTLRKRHEERFETTVERMRALTLDPVCVGAADAEHVHDAFAAWAAARGGRRR